MRIDENNQYDNGMTKPLPTGCIKDDTDLSWGTLHFLLENVSFEYEIGHLFVADIEFDLKNATEREFAYNEIYPAVIEKKKIIDPCERSVFQLLEQYKEGEKGPLFYIATAKAQATMLKKNYQCT